MSSSSELRDWAAHARNSLQTTDDSVFTLTISNKDMSDQSFLTLKKREGVSDSWTVSRVQILWYD
jgi:hypothetical protein